MLNTDAAVARGLPYIVRYSFFNLFFISLNAWRDMCACACSCACTCTCACACACVCVCVFVCVCVCAVKTRAV